MDQTERRRFLIRALLNEQPQYRDMDIPGSEDGPHIDRDYTLTPCFRHVDNLVLQNCVFGVL